MGITVSGLKTMNPSAIDWAGYAFGRSSSSYSSGEDSFLGDVSNKVKSPDIWDGGGQSDASTVMDINLSAMAVGRVQMDTARIAMSTLSSAMQKAQRDLEKSLAEAKEKGVKVSDDGTCEPEDTDSYPLPGLGLDEPGDGPRHAAGRIERDIKGQLAFASLADTSAKGILDYLAVQAPESSSTADLSVLEYNSEQLDEANALHDLAVENQTFWESATPQPIPLDDPLENILSHLGENPGDIGPVLRDVGITAAGVVIALLGAGVEIGSISVSATGVGALVGVPGAIAAAGLVTAGAGTAAYGASELRNDVWELYKKSQKGKGKGGGGGAPRYKPGDNKGATRQYAKSVADAKGRAKKYAERMRKKGYRADVPAPRSSKYGRTDVTVAVYEKTPSGSWKLSHIRHFLVKNPNP